MKHRTPILRPLAGGAAALMLMAACGDNDDAAEVSSAGADETGSTTDTDGESSASGTDTEEELPALLLIMDASGSMEGEGSSGGTLLDEAKQALGDVVDGLPDEQHVGLRVYGHRYPNTDEENGCRDTELIHPVEPLDREALSASINGYEAQGFTPIGLSLEQGANDLPAEGPRTMILVSDGEETCDTDPCAVAEQLADDGIDLVIHTVGFALGDNEQARDELGCIADAGGGDFVDAESAGELTSALEDMSVREDRSFAAEGGELAGAPIPRDANTGELNTPYTDVVLAVEENFYRFEVTPGSEVRGEILMEPAPDLTCVETGALNRIVLRGNLTDGGGDAIDRSADDHALDYPSSTFVVHTDPVTVEDDEVWLKVTTERCRDEPEAELNIEIQVSEV